MNSCLVILLITFTSLSAQAAGIFRYVERDGTVVYSNMPSADHQGKQLSGEFAPAPTPSTKATITKRSGESLANFDAHIEEAARKYKVPLSLVKAVMHAESAFNPNAVSHVGASGLMQLMPATAREMYVRDIFDAKENIEGGVRYLRILANEFGGDMVQIITAYNAGPEAVKRHGGKIPPFKETQAYVRKVLALYFQYKRADSQ